MKNKGLVGIIAAIAIILIVAILWYGIKGNNQPTLSLEEAKEVIETRYSGYVSTIKLADDKYIAILVDGNNNYKVIIDKDSQETLLYSQIETTEGNEEDKNLTLEQKIAQVAPGTLVALVPIEEEVLNKYKAIVLNGHLIHEIEIDGSTKVILSHETEEETKIIEPSVMGDEAIQMAKKTVNGQVEDISLKKEGTKLVYEIEILDAKNKEIEIIIDAMTKEVIKTK